MTAFYVQKFYIYTSLLPTEPFISYYPRQSYWQLIHEEVKATSSILGLV